MKGMKKMTGGGKGKPGAPSTTQNTTRNTNVTGGSMPSMGKSSSPMMTSSRSAKVS